MALKAHNFTIAAGGTVSNSVKLDGRSIVKWEIPACVGTSLAVKDKNSAGVATVAYDDNETAIVLTAAAAARVRFMPPSKLLGCNEISLTSNATETGGVTIIGWSESYTV